MSEENHNGEILFEGSVYICDNCRSLVRPVVWIDEVHVHGNKIVKKCNDFYCDNKIVRSRIYKCPACSKYINLPGDPEAENLEDLRLVRRRIFVGLQQISLQKKRDGSRFKY